MPLYGMFVPCRPLPAIPVRVFSRPYPHGFPSSRSLTRRTVSQGLKGDWAHTRKSDGAPRCFERPPPRELHGSLTEPNSGNDVDFAGPDLVLNNDTGI